MTYNYLTAIKAFHENQSGLSIYESRDTEIWKWTQTDNMRKSYACYTSFRREI